MKRIQTPIRSLVLESQCEEYSWNTFLPWMQVPLMSSYSLLQSHACCPGARILHVAFVPQRIPSHGSVAAKCFTFVHYVFMCKLALSWLLFKLRIFRGCMHVNYKALYVVPHN